MNKYLMMSAAALMASAGTIPTPASAGTTRIGFSGFCDGLQLSTPDGVIWWTKPLYTGCGWTTSTPATFGVTSKNKKWQNALGYKKFLLTGSQASTYLSTVFAVQLPIKTGNAWAGFASTNSSSYWEYNAGTYYTGYSHTKGDRAYLKPSNWMAKGRAKTQGKSNASKE